MRRNAYRGEKSARHRGRASAEPSDDLAARQRVPISAAAHRVRVAVRGCLRSDRSTARAHNIAGPRVRAGDRRRDGMRIRCAAAATVGARSGADRDGSGIRGTLRASGRCLASGVEPGFGAVDRGDERQPATVSESELGHTKRGPLLGIPGAPQLLDQPLAGAESAWAICDSDNGGSTTVVVGPAEDSSAQVLTAEQMILVATESGSPTYLLYGGRRAVVDLADPAVVWALRLQGRVPHVVAQSLLNAVPEAPRITAPRIRGGGRASVGLPGFLVGGVVRITRASGDEYYVVLEDGVQRIGQVAADLLRFGDSQGSVNVPTVAPDVIRVAPIVNTLPVSAFPDRPPTPVDGSPGRAVTTLCVTWTPAQPGAARVAFLAGSGPPVPLGGVPVTLAQADGRGPALDAVYLPPGRSAYVAARSLSGGGTGTRYLVTDTGVRFAIHDDDVAHDLGLPTAAIPAPWPVLATLPSGPELSRANASVARDTVAPGP